MRGTHHHSCMYKANGCENTIECEDSNLIHNFDGFPEILCTFEILGCGTQFICADCENAKVCPDCSIPEYLGHDDDCPFWEHEPFDYPVPIEAYDYEVESNYMQFN